MILFVVANTGRTSKIIFEEILERIPEKFQKLSSWIFGRIPGKNIEETPEGINGNIYWKFLELFCGGFHL